MQIFAGKCNSGLLRAVGDKVKVWEEEGLSFTEIKTERLKLRPLTMDDIDALHQIWTDPGVRKYLWDDEVISREETALVIKKSMEYFRARGFGLCGVTELDDNKMIGFCGYWFFHEPPQLELLYGIITDQWGKGFAPEAANAMLQYGFENLGFHEVLASTDGANLASVRVMEKLGLSFSKRKESNGLDTIFYSLKREEFQHGKAQFAGQPG
jgi:[ribosomal protein S5]-alanine N-acetyltransferase